MAVVTNLTGGLGNQLFQYAMGYALAKKNNDTLYIDISHFKYDKRAFALDLFNISAQKLEVSPARFDNKMFRFFARIRRLNATGLFTTKFMQEEPSKVYNYAYQNVVYNHNIYLNGYWQSWKYFDEYRNLLIHEFRPKIVRKEVQQFIDKVEREESVAVHIRRGDYVECNGWLIDPLFYIKAINKIKNLQYSNLKFYIFCEDESFVKTFFQDMDYEMVTGKYILSDVEEFWVMRACKHKIISNSSFSWWAAYLGKQDNALVVAPVFKQWKKDFYFPGWSTIDLNVEVN